jgi:hypothetical protein
MTDKSDYRRLRHRVMVSRIHRDVAGAWAALDAHVERLEAENERLHATIEAERAVLRGQTVLDSDHAREALAALDELPPLRAAIDAARQEAGT